MTPDGKTLYTQGPDRVGMAALYGGTTTLIDFAYATADRSVQKGIEARDEQFAAKSCCDWAYHLMIGSDPPHTQMRELAEAIQAGYPTVKIFTTNIWPGRIGRMVDFGDIWEVFKVLAKEGGLGVIHAEDNDIVMHMYDKLIREGRVGFENMAEVHNTLSEDLSFRRVIRLAESVPGTALYMMHVSAGTGVAAIREARAKGLPIYGETLHQYMLYTAEDYKLPERADVSHLPVAQVRRGPEGPVGRHAQRRDQLRRHRRAVLHLAREDAGQAHRRHHRRQLRRRAARSASCTPRWSCGAATRSAALRRSRLDQRREDHGPVPAQGRDRGRQRRRHRHPRSQRGAARCARQDLHETDYTPWEGHDIVAWPIMTILRGKVVVENGQFHRSRRRRPVSQAQDPLGNHRRAVAVTLISSMRCTRCSSKASEHGAWREMLRASPTESWS